MEQNERSALYNVKGYLKGTVENKLGFESDEVVKYATKLLQLLEEKLEGEEDENV
ncbi:hypothetical protein ACMGD3_23955 [Lysinibacillus sphaericus]|uniref:hypothetical protein n=1 Tax=Lysinibacillus sphaericus TaxID=1421 RepID=UPI003F7AE212